jgi:dihydrolipoamide dehydrogenase
MKELSCDVAVIGAGTAGLAASGAAHRAGAKVLLIESGPGGTTCAGVGCMPSKLLIAAADVAHQAATASIFGIETAPIRIDGRAVMARVRQERDRFVRSVLKSYEAIPPQSRLEGLAYFIDAEMLEVENEAGEKTRLRAKAIVIATGSRASVPKTFESVAARVLSNETIFELETLPASIAVIGAGPVGIELGQALHRLGVRTTVFDHDADIGGLQDEGINRHARSLFAEELDLRLGVDIEAEPAPGIPDCVRIKWRATSGEGAEGTADFSHVLVAAGRPPNLDALRLQRTGLKLDDHGVPEFDPQTLRCGSSGIFIAGDASAWRPLLHEAVDAGTIAGDNAARFPDVRVSKRRTPLAITFTDPQIAVVGDTLLKQRLVGKADFSDQGRARVMNRNRGCIKLYADPSTNRLIGAEMIGPAVEHLSHLVAWAVQRDAQVRDLLELPFYHPTLEEALRSALRDLCAQMHVAPAYEVGSMEYGPAI